MAQAFGRFRTDAACSLGLGRTGLHAADFLSQQATGLAILRQKVHLCTGALDGHSVDQLLTGGALTGREAFHELCSAHSLHELAERLWIVLLNDLVEDEPLVKLAFLRLLHDRLRDDVVKALHASSVEAVGAAKGAQGVGHFLERRGKALGAQNLHPFFDRHADGTGKRDFGVVQGGRD